MTTAYEIDHGLPATGTSTVSPSFGGSTSSGNFLLAWCNSNDNASSFPISFSGSGWTLAVSGGQAYNWTGIWYKANCGAGETAPSFSDSGYLMAAQLVEFTGVATSSPLDQTGATVGDPVTASAVDSAALDLIVGVVTWNGTNADPTASVTVYGSDGNAAGTGDDLESTGVLAGESGLGDDNPPYYAARWGIGPSSVGAHANKAAASINEYENYPTELIASFKAA